MIIFYNENCPNFFKFVVSEITPVIHDRKIWFALLYSAFGLKTAFFRKEEDIEVIQAKMALCLGHPPVIVPTLIADPNIHAEYKHFPNRHIEVSWNLIRKFESAHTEVKARKYMKATILHEIVHYLDFFDNDPQDFDLNGTSIKKRNGPKMPVLTKDIFLKKWRSTLPRDRFGCDRQSSPVGV